MAASLGAGCRWSGRTGELNHFNTDTNTWRRGKRDGLRKTGVLI